MLENILLAISIPMTIFTYIIILLLIVFFILNIPKIIKNIPNIKLINFIAALLLLFPIFFMAIINPNHATIGYFLFLSWYILLLVYGHLENKK